MTIKLPTNTELPAFKRRAKDRKMKKENEMVNSILKDVQMTLQRVLNGDIKLEDVGVALHELLERVDSQRWKELECNAEDNLLVLVDKKQTLCEYCRDPMSDSSSMTMHRECRLAKQMLSLAKAEKPQ